MIDCSYLTMDAFLPIDRMGKIAESARSNYAIAKPFPHVVLDDFFDPELVDKLLEEFPEPNAIRWQKFDNPHEKKLASATESSFGAVTRLFMYHLNSITFLSFLSKITAIDNLIPDPSFDGGGLHQIVRGGKLGVHADFNKHRHFGLDRRLNLLLYLNKDWRAEYGGDLQLWSPDMTRCEAKISPIYNRVVIFGTTDFTFHGHPDALKCPEQMTRKSLALYYFSNGRPANEVSGEHSTLFRARHEEDFKPSFRQRLAYLAQEVVPPVIWRQFKKIAF